jgi:DNA-binding NarL/FixJ family response regulator
MPYSVLLVDDHKIMRDGIKAILRNEPEFLVVGEAANGVEAVQICRTLSPNLVLMDIRLDGLNGVEATTEILRHCPEARILILSMFDDEAAVVGAIRGGARAFVLKKASDSDLLDAMRTVAKGGSYLSPQVSESSAARPAPPPSRPSSNRSPRASCRSCASSPKANPARRSPSCSASDCKPSAATARR